MTGLIITIFLQARKKDQYLNAKERHIKNGAENAGTEAFFDHSLTTVVLACFWPMLAGETVRKWILQRGRSR
ncbi:MAG: hypothetical protein HYW95_00370 [Candidatus Wildermuthbacteria bacterium]|nr:hypothetical protein [Candidatus Wildermuthbacteria bacterium]